MKNKITYQQIVSKLKQIRKQKGIPQNFVAEALNKFPSYVSKVENGNRRLDVIEFVEFLKVYELDVMEFLDELKEEAEKRDQ